MLDLGGDLVVDDSLLIFAHNVDAKFEVVLRLKFVRLRLSVFGRQSRPIDKGAVGGLDIPDPDLAAGIGPYLGMLPRQHFTVEEAVDWCRHRLCVGLSANPERVWVEGHGYCLAVETSVE